MKRAVLLVLALLAIPCTAYSDDSIGLIIYAEGTEMSIYRDGSLEAFRLNYDAVIGMPVYAGDMLQTGEGTFVEVQLAPAQNVLKVAENTTFTLNSLAGGGNGSFEVTYGRVRAQVRNLSRNDRFEIRGRTAIAGVRGTDFGYDVVAERGGAVEAIIYCFDGEVEVSIPIDPSAQDGDISDGATDEIPIPEDAASTDSDERSVQTVRIRANQMVTVRTEPARRGESERASEPATVPVAEGLEPAISDYWTANDFRRQPVPAGRILDEFPELRDRVIKERGIDILELLSADSTMSEEEPHSEAESEEEVKPTISQRVAGTPSDEEADEPLSPEEIARRVAQRRQFNRTAGWIVTTAGALVTGASFGVEYYGHEYLPNMTPETRESVRQGTLVSGSILLATGIASFIMSFF